MQHSVAIDLELIDHAAMAEMWRDAGPALFRQIAALFEDEGARRMAQMPAALAAQDRTQLAFDAHTLKGAAAYICAPRLQHAARALERHAPSATPDELAALVAAVLSAARLTGPALAEAMAAMPA